MLHAISSETKRRKGGIPSSAANAASRSPALLGSPLVTVQSAYGNQAMLRYLSAAASPPRGVESGVLQRKCACGGSGADCAECKKKEPELQRKATSADGRASSVPAIVHDVLRSPGQPLDRGTRAFMESRLGHEFSSVRIHTDAQAARSALAVNALAYTVGRDVVFAGDRHNLESHETRRLLAHELTHVIQQSNSPSNDSLRIGPDAGPLEDEANRMENCIPGISRLTNSRSLLQRKVDTDSCGTLDPDVRAAHKKAMEMTTKALALLDSYDGSNPVSVSNALSKHFHTTSLDDARNIIGWIRLAKDGAEDATYECHAGEDHDGAIGWSMWRVPFTNILLYKPWFETSRTQVKKAKTMIHEWMHRYSWMYDLGYEGSDAYNQSSTFRAINNAAPYAALIEALGC